MHEMVHTGSHVCTIAHTVHTSPWCREPLCPAQAVMVVGRGMQYAPCIRSTRNRSGCGSSTAAKTQTHGLGRIA